MISRAAGDGLGLAKRAGMISRILPFALALPALALAACSGSVEVSTSGSGGSGGGQTSTGTVTATTSTGTGGTCARTTDSFSFTLTNGTSLDCSGSMPGQSAQTHLEAQVSSSTPTSMLLETCPPNADCGGDTTASFQVNSPGFTFNIPAGTFVQIDVRIDYPWGCAQTILVRNLPTWGGLPSPYSNLPLTFFAGSDGAVGALDGTPFSVTNVALGCDGTNMGCGIADDHRLDVGGLSGPPMPVYQGNTAQIHVLDSGEERLLSFRNLRSFETGWCDDYWNWAWWATSDVFIPD